MDPVVGQAAGFFCHEVRPAGILPWGELSGRCVFWGLYFSLFFADFPAESILSPSERLFLLLWMRCPAILRSCDTADS